MRSLSPQELNQCLDNLQSSSEPLERFLHVWAASFNAPILYDSGKQHIGFRYGTTSEAHFCLLKFVRALSAIQASICLARSGFAQEIGVLVRTLIECTTLIEFVLNSRDADGALMPKAKELVDSFFRDFARNDIKDYAKSKLRQGEVHAILGAAQDLAVSQTESATQFAGIQTEQLYSRVYLTFSSYVHCKYPETMDLWGGTPAHFHLRGMNGTPKDYENVVIIQTFLNSVQLCAVLIVVSFKLSKLIERDHVLSAWYASTNAKLSH